MVISFFYSAYSCYVHLSTVGVMNIAADHQMFRTLTGDLSWQRLRRSPVDLYSKSEKISFEPPFRALRGNVRTPSMARWRARGRSRSLCHSWATCCRLWYVSSQRFVHTTHTVGRSGASIPNSYDATFPSPSILSPNLPSFLTGVRGFNPREKFGIKEVS